MDLKQSEADQLIVMKKVSTSSERIPFPPIDASLILPLESEDGHEKVSDGYLRQQIQGCEA